MCVKARARLEKRASERVTEGVILLWHLKKWARKTLRWENAAGVALEIPVAMATVTAADSRAVRTLWRQQQRHHLAIRWRSRTIHGQRRTLTGTLLMRSLQTCLHRPPVPMCSLPFLLPAPHISSGRLSQLAHIAVMTRAATDPTTMFCRCFRLRESYVLIVAAVEIAATAVAIAIAAAAVTVIAMVAERAMVRVKALTVAVAASASA